MTRRMYIGVASTPAAATVDTAGEGGFFGGAVNGTALDDTASASGAADQVQAYQFVLPYRAVVGKIVFEVTTLSVGAFASVGIYSADGNTRLVHAGAISTTLAEVKDVTLASSVTLEPGVYVFSHTVSDATAKLRAFITSDAIGSGFRNTNGDRQGNAANASVSGVLPATLGAITTTGTNIAAAYFEP
ncbi:hypothetical protein LCGC14_2869420 [marine sediment metagenome]|uniref:Uncharacterized protein n=1 Tax=marine sediment metagenome TaxID=412755 RepID=A0A0F9AUL4_9ZZZZ